MEIDIVLSTLSNCRAFIHLRVMAVNQPAEGSSEPSRRPVSGTEMVKNRETLM